MDYRTSSAVALSQKLSTGHSIYDGVFSSAPAEFTVSSFSSTLDDYREIFGGGGASSIPVLEVPELNERKVDVRSSQLDYSNVFGGFGDSDFAVPYEKLFDEPKMQKETRRQSERVSPPKEAKRSCSEEGIDLANEAAYESIDGVKKFSMSYNQSNHRSKSFSGVHSVPAYTCLVDETSPLRATEGDKPVSMSSVAKERRMEGNRSAKAMRDQPAGDAGKQASGGGGGVKAENDSNWKNSIDELFKTNKSGLGTHPSSVPPFTSQVSEVDKPVSLVANDASIVNGQERKMGGNHHIKTTGDQQATDASKQTSGGVARVQNSSKWRSSGSVDKLFYSGELAQESRPSNMPPFSSMRSDGKGEFEKPMASAFGVLNRDTFEGADNVSSSPYFDEEVDTNSVAAASVAALTKAIEEAQASIQMAKELMDRKKVGPQSRVKLSFDNSMKPKSRKGSKFADKASISKETKTREPYNKVDVPVHVSAGLQQVTPVFENAFTISDVTVTGEEVRGKEFADNTCIFTKKTDELQEEVHVSGKEFADNACIFTKKTDELQEEVHVSGKEFADNACIFTKKTDELQEEVHVSAQPEQVTVILADTDKHYGVMEARGKVHGHEFEPTPTDHRHEEADDLEAADQFYEFSDTSEQDVSEASEQFYEFADSSEPDVSEATEEFYEFADSNEHHDIVLENEKANNPRQMFQSVDYEEQEKKTDMEAFENPEQVGKISKAVTAEEQRGVENLLGVVEEVSEFEEIDELASSQECSNQEDNEKPEEAPREHEETGKLKTTHVKETCEEKQNGDEKRFETQELQEIEHVKINLVTQEWDENEKIDKEGCVLEENEREQPYAQSEEDSDSTLNEHKKEEIIESVNGFYDKEDFEKRLEDDRISEGNEKLQDTRPNEKILEEVTCQKECENHQEESFEFIEAGRMQIEMDESTRIEKVQATQEERENLDCIIEAADNLNEQDVCEALDSKQGSARDVDCDQDTRPNEKILEEATCQKECENHQEESFEFIEAGRMQIEMDESTRNEKVQATQEERENLDCIIEAADNLNEQDVCEALDSKQGSARDVDCDQDTRPNEKILEEATCQKECENHQEESFEFIEAGRMQIEMDESTINEKVQATQEEQENLDCIIEAADNLNEQDVCEALDSKQGSARDVDCDQDVKETLKLPINKEDGGVKEVAGTSIQLEENKGVKEVAGTSIQLEENEHQTELVEEENGMVEKEICQTDGLTPGVQLPERPKQMEDATEIHSLDKNGISASESDMSFVQTQDDQLLGEPSVDYNVGRQVEECEEWGDNSDMMKAEVVLNQERNKNGSKSRKRWFGTNEVSEPFIKLEGDGNQSESVEEEDVMEEKVICEIEGLASGVKFAEILKQMEDVVEIHSSDTNGTSVYGQKQDGQLAREPEVVCYLQKHVEEFGDINKDMTGPEVAAVNQAESMNITKSSHRKRWFDNGKDTKVAQAPHIFCRKAGSVLLDNDTDTSLSTKRDKENHHKVMTSQSTEVNEDSQQATLSPKESETIHSSLKEFEQENNANPQTTLSAEESETDHNSLEVEPQSQAIPRAKETETNFIFQKEVEREKENQQESQTANEFEISASSQKVVELEKEHLIQKAEKRRERERQKEKRKVAQVFRETRERSFADVKEKVAETRQKEMAEAQGKLGKTSVQANDTSLAEKASKEAKAKQKWERAAVERITAEARDRALEKALSEKVAAEAGKQAKRSVPEKYSGASTDGKQAKRSVSEKFAGASRDNGLSRSLDLESKGSFSSSTSRSSNSSNLSELSTMQFFATSEDVVLILTEDPSPAEQSTGTNGESAQRFKATLERNQRTAERAAKALAEKNNRDLLVQQEQAERNRLAEVLDAEVKRWSSGKERNLRALLSTLQYILGPDSGWQPVPLTDIVTAVAVKKAYRKAALFVHPDKLQQRGASIQQKYTCEKVFDLLKDAWNRFSMDER
ncbi:hypothetical protein ACLB2K_009392 [Fragaria x ananassa]